MISLRVKPFGHTVSLKDVCLLAVTALILFAVSATSRANETEKQCVDGLVELQALLDKMQSLSAEFHQLVTSADGYPLQEVDGVMYISKPGRIRWESLPPYEQLVVADGEKLWLYDPDLEQVTVKPLEENLSYSPAALLVGDAGNLSERYRVCQETNDGALRITLTPLEQNSVYSRIVLSFVSDVPASITMADSLGQSTEVTLSAVFLNPKLKASLFVFNPPEGVDIFRDR